MCVLVCVCVCVCSVMVNSIGRKVIETNMTINLIKIQVLNCFLYIKIFYSCYNGIFPLYFPYILNFIELSNIFA